jgi:malate dehydrogenase
MYADYRNCTSNGDNVKALINDPAWNNDVFLPTVGKRGAAIIDARGLSSAASAANAAIDHMRDWVLGSDEWVTMGVPSDGLLRHPGGHRLRLPVRMQGRLVQDHPGPGNRRILRDKINKTLKELTDEATPSRTCCNPGIFAQHRSKGRGKMPRPFFSPPPSRPLRLRAECWLTKPATPF